MSPRGSTASRKSHQSLELERSECKYKAVGHGTAMAVLVFSSLLFCACANCNLSIVGMVQWHSTIQ